MSVLHSDFACQTLEHLGSTGVVEAHAALGLQILRKIGQFAWTEYWLYTSVAERKGNLFDYHVHWAACCFVRPRAAVSKRNKPHPSPVQQLQRAAAKVNRQRLLTWINPDWGRPVQNWLLKTREGVRKMPSQKSETAVSQAVQFPLLPQLEWSKKAIEMSATACAGALGFTAKRLQAQADFLQNLAVGVRLQAVLYF